MSPLVPAPASRSFAGGAYEARGACEGHGADGPPPARVRVRTTDPALRDVAVAVRQLLAPHVRLAEPDPETGEGAGTAENLAGTEGGAHTLWLALGRLDGSPRPTAVPTAVPAGVPAAVGVPPDGAAQSDECYALTVDPTGLTCRARTPVGVFRAAATALHLLAAGAPVPSQRIADGPRFAWRGLMVDVARSFRTPEELRAVIDLMALYKLNVLHLHLTDNEGWRLEIAGRPGLAGDTDRDDSASGERRYYTAAEYRALQEYAASRFVTVVPEVDLPGHCAAVLRACPEAGTVPRPAWLPEHVAYTPPLDPGDAGARAVVRDTLGEVARLTDGPFVHIGGDEALGIDGEDFARAVHLAREAVRACGKRPLGWQESARAGAGPQDIGQFWVDLPMTELPATEDELARRPDLLAAGWTLPTARALRRFFAPSDHDLGTLLDAGAKVLLSPQSHLYLDRPYDPAVAPSPDAAALSARIGFTYRPRTVRHAAAWDPDAYGVPEEQIAGVEATVFCERVRDFTDVTTLLLPRLAGFAETAWSARPPAWGTYAPRLAAQSRLWRARGLSYFATTETAWL